MFPGGSSPLNKGSILRISTYQTFQRKLAVFVTHVVLGANSATKWAPDPVVNGVKYPCK